MRRDELPKEIALCKLSYNGSDYEQNINLDHEKKTTISRRDYMTLALVGIKEIGDRVNISGRVVNVFVQYAQIMENYLFDEDPAALLKEANDLIASGAVTLQPERKEPDGDSEQTPDTGNNNSGQEE